MSSVYCHHCGAANPVESVTCFACQHALDMTEAQEQTPLLRERYRLRAQVGTGGFGAVYRAEDNAQADAIVAIKQINLGGLSAQEKIEATDGFYREVRLLSGLKHPNLPTIHNSFTDPEHWYIVMDFIDGETLETYMKDRFSGQQEPGLPLREVLDLGLQLCAVLDYLHTRQPPIIFRDLKPANIMRTRAGQVYLIDFGIARHFIPGKPKDTIPFGSPGYAPPEQYGRAQTTPQADIYSLGALLHQALSGDDPAESPFRFAPLRLYGPAVMADLNELIQSMVRVDSGERPTSTAEVKETLSRLADEQEKVEPRVWRPPETALTLPQHYTTYTGWHNGASLQQQQVAKPQGTFNRRRLISTGLKLGGTALVGYGIVQVCQVASFLFRPDFSGVILDENFTPAPAPTPKPDYVFSQHTGPVTTIAWSRSGQMIASGSADKTVLVWRARDGVLLYKFTGYQSPVTSVTWSFDDMCVASSGDDNGTVQVWDATDNKDIRSYPEQTRKVLALSWAYDKTLMASGGEDKTVRVWNANDGTAEMTLHGHTGSVRAVKWSLSDALNLASASADKTVRTWGGTLHQAGIYSPNDIVYRGHTAGVNALAWSQNGQMIASASDDGTVQVWNAADGSHVVTYRGHQGPVNAVTWLSNYSSSGEVLWLASGGQDTTVQVWDLSGRLISTYRKHTKPIRSIASAWITYHMRIASASDDHTVHVWTPGQ